MRVYIGCKCRSQKPNRIPIFIYLTKTFDLKLPHVMRLGAWKGFQDGHLPDNEIINLFDALISRNSENDNQ